MLSCSSISEEINFFRAVNNIRQEKTAFNEKIKLCTLPDLGVGFWWSSITCSKKRFLSDTVLGVSDFAEGGGVGDWNFFLFSSTNERRQEQNKLTQKKNQQK